MIYINLTSGLEWLKDFKTFELEYHIDYEFVRIQSSLLESKCFDKVLLDLDYNFLFDLAQGNLVEIYDTSRKKKMSRALYQGVPFIEYVLNRRWFDKKTDAFVNDFNVTDYFEKVYQNLDRSTKNKLDYVKKFVTTDEFHIETYCKKSLFDGKYEVYKEMLRND